MPRPELLVFPDVQALAAAAAQRTAALIRDAPSRRPFSLVLSGGSTPRPYHQALATTFRDAIPWGRVHVFWGDERYVPREDPASNYGMADATLLQHVPLSQSNVHPMPTDAPTPAHAATQYEVLLRQFLAAQPRFGFDLMLLGLGDDGHTASLFPGAPALAEKQRWVVAVEGPSYVAPRTRLSLTLPLINLSRHVFFLVAGEQKRTPLAAILRDGQAAPYPAARVTARERLVWFADTAAADKLAEN